MKIIWFKVRNAFFRLNPHLRVLLVMTLLTAFVVGCLLTEGALFIATFAVVAFGFIYLFVYEMVTGQF